MNKTRDIGCLYGITHTCQVLKRQMNRLEVLNHAVPRCAWQFDRWEVSTGLLNEEVDAGVQSVGDSRWHRNRPIQSGTVLLTGRHLRQVRHPSMREPNSEMRDGVPVRLLRGRRRLPLA